MTLRITAGQLFANNSAQTGEIIDHLRHVFEALNHGNFNAKTLRRKAAARNTGMTGKSEIAQQSNEGTKEVRHEFNRADVTWLHGYMVTDGKWKETRIARTPSRRGQHEFYR